MTEAGGSVVTARDVPGVTTPIRDEPDSANNRLPSGPAAMPEGLELAVGMANSVMASVVGLIIPMLFAPYSVNQRSPSGPTAIPVGWAAVVGTGNAAMAWVVGLIMPILSP